jgi:membrane protein involved in colicin uptake
MKNMNSSKNTTDHHFGWALVPVIAALTLLSAPAQAVQSTPSASSQAATASPAQAADLKQAQKEAKLAQKSQRKAAKLAAKKAKICAKQPGKNKKKAAKLARKKAKWGCAAPAASTADAKAAVAVTSPALADATGNKPGVDPATLPLLFTPTLGNNGNNASNSTNGNGGANASSDTNGNSANKVDEPQMLAVAPAQVPEPGTLGLLGLGLLAAGFARRRK